MAETFSIEQHLPFAGWLSGPTIGDNVRHLVAREALLDLLYAWPATQELFDRINGRTGVLPATIAAARGIDEFAQVAGFETRRAVWEAMRKPVFEAPVGDVTGPDINPYGHRMMDAIEAFSERSYIWGKDKQTSWDVYVLVRDFVLAHKMPWPWLAVELLFEANTSAWSFVYQVKLERHRLVREQEPSGVTEVSFTVAEGIPLTQAIEQLSDYQSALEAMLESARVVPRGRIPKEQIPKIQRNAGWYFNVVVCQEPILSVARKAFPPPEVPMNRRRDIKQGLDSVRRYLEMTPYYFTDRGVIARKDGYPLGKEDITG